MHNAEHANPLERMPLSTPLRLSALWVSVTLCYLYGDYFGLYVPGKLQRMLDGQMGPLGAVTQRVLLGTAVMMAIPALMVVLSQVLVPRVSRWLNIVAAALFTAIMVLTMPGAWRFYQFLGVIEVTLTLAIIWTAWRWPRRAG